ncbi:MAG: hypothetical protein ACTSPB_05625 [Candidatus Thorarchaeota archaeon]
MPYESDIREWVNAHFEGVEFTKKVKEEIANTIYVKYNLLVSAVRQGNCRAEQRGEDNYLDSRHNSNDGSW